MPLARKASIVKLRNTVRDKAVKYSRRLSVGALKVVAPNSGDSVDKASVFSFDLHDVPGTGLSPAHVAGPRSPSSPSNRHYRNSSVPVSPRPYSVMLSKEYTSFDGGKYNG